MRRRDREGAPSNLIDACNEEYTNRRTRVDQLSERTAARGRRPYAYSRWNPACAISWRNAGAFPLSSRSNTASPEHLAAPNDDDVADHGAVHGEDALDADAVGHLSDGDVSLTPLPRRAMHTPSNAWSRPFHLLDAHVDRSVSPGGREGCRCA